MARVRVPLEALALELAKGRASEQDLQEMRTVVDRMVVSYASDLGASAREDLAFHEKLWGLTNNPWLIVALRRITLPFFLFVMIYRVQSEDLDPGTFENQHQLYLDYLRGATRLTAEECVRLHLRMYEGNS